jgi:hypothetical protein
MEVLNDDLAETLHQPIMNVIVWMMLVNYWQIICESCVIANVRLLLVLVKNEIMCMEIILAHDNSYFSTAMSSSHGFF